MIWYEKIWQWIKNASGLWIIIPLILSIFNAVSRIEFWSWNAWVNYGFLVLFFILFLIQKGIKDSQKISEAKKRRHDMDNLCEDIHEELKLGTNYRISIFEMKNECLEVIGRFSEYQSNPITQVRFKPGVGCVGIAYYSGKMNIIDDLPDFKTSPDEYYDKMKQQGNMTKEEVEKLARKHRSYLSVPIKYRKSGAISAIVTFDHDEPMMFGSNQELVSKIGDYLSQSLISTHFPKKIA